jgi:two-component system sensor histidine kinase CpxA
MKVSFPLSLKVSLWLLVNLLLLAVAAGVFYVSKFGLGLESVTRGAMGEQLQSIAYSIASDLQTEPEGVQPAILASRGRKYGADFFLFTNEGAQRVGDAVDLPAVVREEVNRGLRRGDPPEDEPGERPDRSGSPPSKGPPDQRPSTTDGPPPEEREPRAGPPPRGRRPREEGRFVIETHAPEIIWIGLRLPIPDRFGQTIPGTIIIRATSLWTVARLLLAGPWLALASGAVVLSVLFWLPLVGRITRALKSLSRATERIAEGEFSTRVEIHRRDELGHLGRSVNRMADRLDTLVNGQKRFLGDVAHELGSPIGRLQVAVEILETRAEPALQAHVADVREEVQHMAALVGELLAFTKAGLLPRDPALAAVPLTPLIQRMLAREDSAGRVTAAITDDFRVLAEATILERLLGNLVRNALRYAPAGVITLGVRTVADRVVISVSDEGPGVPPEALARLGEPFFRPDAARTTEAGGTGLGLAIVRTGVAACRGTVMFRNRTPRGFEAEIALSLA